MADYTSSNTGAAIDGAVDYVELLDNIVTVDSGNSRIGINNGSPASALDVTGSVTAVDIIVEGSTPSILLTDTTGPYTHTIQAVNQELRIEANDDLRIETNNTQRMRIDGATGDISFYDTAGTSQALFWDASAESLGIGTSTPASAIEISGSALTGTGVRLSNTSTSRSWTIGTSNSPNVFGVYDNTDTAFRLAIDTSGHAIIPAGVTLGTAAGVYAAANTLDYYEEGNWTPAINVGTISASNASYTRVGNLVTVRATIADISDNTSTANIQISGLPFPSAGGQASAGSMIFRYFSRTDAAQMTPYVASGQSRVDFYWSFNSSSAWDEVQFSDGTSANMDIVFSTTYQV
jgi:hypothetical protein